MHSAPDLITRIPHHRSPRQWPYLRADPVVLPYPTPPNQPPATTLLVTVASLLGIGLSVFVLGSQGSSAGLGVGLLAISGTTALASIAVYLIQRRAAARDTITLLHMYSHELDHLEGRLSDPKVAATNNVMGSSGPGLTVRRGGDRGTSEYRPWAGSY